MTPGTFNTYVGATFNDDYMQEASVTLRAEGGTPSVLCDATDTFSFQQNERGEVRHGDVIGSLASNPCFSKGQGASLICERERESNKQ